MTRKRKVTTRRKSEITDLTELEEFDLYELQRFADRVGVGFKDLDADQLRNKLRSEGVPA